MSEINNEQSALEFQQHLCVSIVFIAVKSEKMNLCEY